jgi:hypothetical protein
MSASGTLQTEHVKFAMGPLLGMERTFVLGQIRHRSGLSEYDYISLIVTALKLPVSFERLPAIVTQLAIEVDIGIIMLMAENLFWQAVRRNLCLEEFYCFLNNANYEKT